MSALSALQASTIDLKLFTVWIADITKMRFLISKQTLITGGWSDHYCMHGGISVEQLAE